MNIKNHPMTVIGNHDQNKLTLLQENEGLKKENTELKEQWYQAVYSKDPRRLF